MIGAVNLDHLSTCMPHVCFLALIGWPSALCLSSRIELSGAYQHGARLWGKLCVLHLMTRMKCASVSDSSSSKYRKEERWLNDKCYEVVVITLLIYSASMYHSHCCLHTLLLQIIKKGLCLRLCSQKTVDWSADVFTYFSAFAHPARIVTWLKPVGKQAVCVRRIHHCLVCRLHLQRVHSNIKRRFLVFCICLWLMNTHTNCPEIGAELVLQYDIYTVKSLVSSWCGAGMPGWSTFLKQT